MGKAVHNTVLDGAFNILDNGDIMTVCNAEPTTRTEAVTTFALADVAMTPGTDYTIADAGGGGRQCTVAQKASILVDAAGTATHVAICDATNVLFVTTCTSQALTDGNTVTVPQWVVTIGDPT